MKNIQSAQRVSQADVSDNYVYQRSLLAYHRAAEIASGDVLEIGTGSGYGVSVIAPKVKSYITIDKFDNDLDLSAYPNAEFHVMRVPPISDIATNSIDTVVTFQVIEHIKQDFELMQEIHRVLRPSGKLIISTPNKSMSLTRNPWHVREYTIDEFKNLCSALFKTVEAYGVFGDELVMEYYNANKRSVEKMRRLDFFDLEHKLPAWMLRIPYDILNRINRRKLLIANRSLTSAITMQDYSIEPAAEGCFDLFFVATK